MMLLNFYCPVCMAELLEKKKSGECVDIKPMYSNAYEVLNNGIYKTHCLRGHEGTVVLQNLNFEILFDLGINALADGYYREAVASLTSAMERYFEFFVKVAWRKNGLEFDVIDKNWKTMSNQSERQLGAYVMAYSSLFATEAIIMKNNDTSFRNAVIHKGEIPSKEKTADYVTVIRNLIVDSLEKLRRQNPDVLIETYKHYLPQYGGNDSEDVLLINQPTIISVLNGLDGHEYTPTESNVDKMLQQVIDERTPHRLRLTNDAQKLIDKDIEEANASIIAEQNAELDFNEYKIVIPENATIDDCYNKLQELVKNYDEIIKVLSEKDSTMFDDDMLTVGLVNTQINTTLYLLYLKTKICQLKFKLNPQDLNLKEDLAKAEKEFEAFHKGLSCAD